MVSRALALPGEVGPTLYTSTFLLSTPEARYDCLLSHPPPPDTHTHVSTQPGTQCKVKPRVLSQQTKRLSE